MEIWGEGLVGSEKWTGEQTHNGHIKTESFFKCVHLACFFFPEKWQWLHYCTTESV